jgi:hypothetical protein
MENLSRKRDQIHCKGWKTIPLFVKKNKRFRFKVIINQLRKLKAQRLRWTTAWRRLHKKIKVSDAGKAKKQKALKL